MVKRIGLLRHFEVSLERPPGWISAQQVVEWLRAYDEAPVIRKVVDLGNLEWHRCLSSPLPRAYETAQTIFPGPISQNRALREVEMGLEHSGGLRLPFSGWRVLLRLAWMVSHPSQRARKADFLNRIQQSAQEIIACGDPNVLVVSHAGVMLFLRKELLRNGFIGPKFSVAEHALLYVFERHC